MSKRQLLALFLCSLVPWTVGNGLLPLLPIYATQLGAPPSVAGYYLAFSYLALAIGAVAAGWLSEKLQRRKILLIVAGAVCIPAMWLMGRVVSIWQLTALTATVWFSGGLALALISILAGLFAEESERGRVFGTLSLTNGLGALAGGFTTGPIVDRWGYPTMFATLALFMVLWPLAGLFLQDKEVRRREETPIGVRQVGLGRSFYYLLLASLTAAVSGFVGLLGRSLAMDRLGFAAAAVASTGAIGGAATLPLLPLVGWLSDRVGRKRFLILCYVAGTAGLLVLALSVSLWHFWIASLLLTILMAVNSGVGPALVTDLASRESLGRGLSLYGAVGWIGGVIGFASTGCAVQNLGVVVTCGIGAFLTVIAIVLLIPVGPRAEGKGRHHHSENSRRRIAQAEDE